MPRRTKRVRGCESGSPASGRLSRRPCRVQASCWSSLSSGREGTLKNLWRRPRESARLPQREPRRCNKLCIPLLKRGCFRNRPGAGPMQSKRVSTPEPWSSSCSTKVAESCNCILIDISTRPDCSLEETIGQIVCRNDIWQCKSQLECCNVLCSGPYELVCRIIDACVMPQRRSAVRR